MIYAEEQIKKLKERIEPLRQEIIHHELYTTIKNIKDIRIFMEHHVFAVWDFMSLLKTLQKKLTCTEVPWRPVGNPETRYLINEIVTGEESDIDENGKRTSHLELYLRSMEQAGANTKTIKQLLTECSRSNFILDNMDTPDGTKDFVNFTFDVISSDKTHAIASVFTFGREDLIPGMFMRMIDDLNRKFPKEISVFKYYLDRHIEIDGEHHSKLAIAMVSELCGEDDDKWEEAGSYAEKALQNRKLLWDKVLACLK
ncbi:MAG: DUF3050 domain-containing protein [Bacteroidota bacterium]|jgi:hypothetical protein